uniref:Uncharacterized protein n=1 Tax=Arundo donax TaxID=35708 RepID=A0A0A9BZT0_ARUDO
MVVECSSTIRCKVVQLIFNKMNKLLWFSIMHYINFCATSIIPNFRPVITLNTPNVWL